MIEKDYLLDDEQIRRFIVNGYVQVQTDLPAALHETIFEKTDTIFGGAQDMASERRDNPLNNILPLVPELGGHQTRQSLCTSGCGRHVPGRRPNPGGSRSRPC